MMAFALPILCSVVRPTPRVGNHSDDSYVLTAVFDLWNACNPCGFRGDDAANLAWAIQKAMRSLWAGSQKRMVKLT